MTYTGPRYDRQAWSASVKNGQIPRDKLAIVEYWPTWDADLNGPALAHPEAAASVGVLLRRADEEGFGDLAIAYSYRTLAKQWEKWRSYLSGNGNLAARPGYSNHGLAVSFDMRWGRSVTYVWLRNNAYRHGFIFDVPGESWHMTYQENVWDRNDMTKEELETLQWMRGFRNEVIKFLPGGDSGASIGQRVRRSIKHAQDNHVTPRHVHPGGTTSPADDGHTHKEGLTGPSVER